MNKLDKLNTGVSDLYLWAIDNIKLSVSSKRWKGIATGFTTIKNSISSESPPDDRDLEAIINDLSNKSIDEILNELSSEPINEVLDEINLNKGK